MLRSRKVTSGKHYVNNARTIAREVVEINDDAITSITYHLDTGALTGNPSACMKHHFTHWAYHEDTQMEIAWLQRYKM